MSSPPRIVGFGVDGYVMAIEALVRKAAKG